MDSIDREAETMTDRAADAKRVERIFEKRAGHQSIVRPEGEQEMIDDRKSRKNAELNPQNRIPSQGS
jgi:hypothetical protein